MNVRLLLPIIVEYDGDSLLVYFDQLKNEIIIPNELCQKYEKGYLTKDIKKEILSVLNKNTKSIKIPDIPTESFELEEDYLDGKEEGRS